MMCLHFLACHVCEKMADCRRFLLMFPAFFSQTQHRNIKDTSGKQSRAMRKKISKNKETFGDRIETDFSMYLCKEDVQLLAPDGADDQPMTWQRSWTHAPFWTITTKQAFILWLLTQRMLCGPLGFYSYFYIIMF